MYCSPPGSSLHGIFLVRTLEWVATGVHPRQDAGIPSGWRCRQIGKVKRIERGLIFLGLHRKPIKLLTWNLLCSQRPQAPSRWGEDAGCPLPGEDAGRLPNRVLEAHEKSELREPLCPKESSWKKKRERKKEKERKKEWHGETKLWWSQVCSFIFKKSFYTLSYTFPEVKDTESCRVSSTLHQFYLHRDQDVFCIAFHLQGCLCYAHYLLARRPIDILWPFSDKGWSTRKLVFPLKCFFFICPIFVSLRKY